MNELAKEIHETSVDKGFYDHERSSHEILVLIHSEVTEVMDEFRIGSPITKTRHSYQDNGHVKPEGIPIEFADILIRVLDAAAFYKIDIDKAVQEKMEYNKTRPYKHGKQF